MGSYLNKIIVSIQLRACSTCLISRAKRTTLLYDVSIKKKKKSQKKKNRFLTLQETLYYTFYVHCVIVQLNFIKSTRIQT